MGVPMQSIAALQSVRSSSQAWLNTSPSTIALKLD
jgi:hypothetical protein